MRTLPPHRGSAVRSALALATLVAVSAIGGRLDAQVRVDPVSGDYFVTVRNDQGALVEMRVEPPNKVRATLTPQISVAGSVLRYTYTAVVTSDSRQDLAFLEVDCPSAALVQSLTARATVQGSSAPWFAEFDDFQDRPSCSFERGADGLPVGGTLVATLETSLLPAVGSARVQGKTAGVNWPTSDPIPDNDDVRDVVESLSGLTGGWLTMTTIVPRRDPGLFDDPVQGLAAITGDLTFACGPAGWITSDGVCNSLQAKLRAAQAAVAGNAIENARAALRDFLTELDAQHGTTAGKHVTDNAYSLLKVNVESLLARL